MSLWHWTILIFEMLNDMIKMREYFKHWKNYFSSTFQEQVISMKTTQTSHDNVHVTKFIYRLTITTTASIPVHILHHSLQSDRISSFISLTPRRFVQLKRLFPSRWGKTLRCSKCRCLNCLRCSEQWWGGSGCWSRGPKT